MENPRSIQRINVKFYDVVSQSNLRCEIISPALPLLKTFFHLRQKLLSSMSHL